ncbi:glutamyl-tRNA(Gln) amidotransferase subunit HER2 NDAI_0C03630 [Naumovozyma dairenensis CBS 421]|uniref:Glutamyl-tRNA(Gln) amidotransferase subunit A, mitochondrial n=1 Tax=Naumovozyma dairenensis (strain ATCC 10597 / BCRC 20456 / CBS 421 / NBRC 0211 / NRRL Y-12639) TaxID=1071378 RepID=G0W8B2_NAUDC|nr:hypothetical protein NDAI_0C03630 [Naumovozyma dairenensis CBS 421]CCD24023.1 hypothetical protein NDAI_0C03630 [Naumovozyma dairenensis CBS 421]
MSQAKSIDHVIKALPKLQSRYNIFAHLEPSTKILQRYNDIQKNQPNSTLAGTISAIKDNIVTQDSNTTCASQMLKEYKSPFTATIVKLLSNAGTTIVGKTNMDEFAMGSLGIHSCYGPTINPSRAFFANDDMGKREMVTGGSSSGSAAAVSATIDGDNIIDFALGTDTGGSVRLPASYCSVLGFKGSYGRISRYGVVSFAQSLDTVGIFAKDLPILRGVFDVLNKYDRKDPTSLNDLLRNEIIELSDKCLHRLQNPLRIGIVQEFNQESVDKDIKSAFHDFIGQLMEKGYTVVPISIPSIKYSLPIYYTLAPSEAVSNLSRYDGIRFGTRDPNEDVNNEAFFSKTRSNFGTEVRNRLILGNYNLSSSFAHNNYIQAQKLRVNLINEFDFMFKFPNVLTRNKANVGDDNGIDFIISPTSLNKPTFVRRAMSDKIATDEYFNDIFTIPASLAGLPTMTIPIRGNEPIGIQIMGQYGDDQGVLDFTSTLMKK